MSRPTASSALKILAVHPVPDLYGADLMLLRSVAAMRRRGHDVTVCVPEDGPLLERMAQAEIPTEVVGFPVLRKSLLSPVALALLALGLPLHLARLVRLIARHQPDIVYVNTLTLPHWLFAARLARVPLVCHVRELESLSGRLLARGLTAPLLLADRLITNSRATSDFLVGCWGRFAPRCHVVYNGFTFPQVPAPEPPSSSRSRIVLVGRLSPRKGQDIAVEAVARLVREGYDVELELVGSTFRGYEWFETTLVEQAGALGIQDRVIFSGFSSSVWTAYTNADISVVPSRIEPFGSVAVEAMAMATPVVVARVGGLPEIVDDGHTGLVVRPDDVDDLVLALRRLLEDPAWASSLGGRACSVVRTKYTQPRYEAELVAVVVST